MKPSKRQGCLKVRDPCMVYRKGQKMIADIFPMVNFQKFSYCQNCKRKFETRMHLYQHLKLEKCVYYGGSPWVSFIFLPEPALLLILRMLSLVDFVNALMADDRLLLTHGVRLLWRFRMRTEHPKCYWIKCNLKILRLLDHCINDRRQGSLTNKTARDIRTKKLNGQYFCGSLRTVIWSLKADREHCYCIKQHP